MECPDSAKGEGSLCQSHVDIHKRLTAPGTGCFLRGGFARHASLTL